MCLHFLQIRLFSMSKHKLILDREFQIRHRIKRVGTIYSVN